MIHRVRLNMVAAGKYSVVGSGVSIPSTTTPIVDAAAALRKAGHPDTDLIAVDCGEITVSPQTIGAILRSRPTSHRNNLMREMMGFDHR